MGYILFSSEENISISADYMWDGTLEYSYNNQIWQKWYGETIINNAIYIRGVNNTQITCGLPWGINGKNIKCQGNIENLLDYKYVINNVHPKVANDCFSLMFMDCTSLIEAPQLSSIELSNHCYGSMFQDCSSLITVPTFPKVKLAELCYQDMFCGCISLQQSPLSFISSTHNSYYGMLKNCRSLDTYPIFANLPIAKEAIINQHMFDNCSISCININNKLYDINVLKLL